MKTTAKLFGLVGLMMAVGCSSADDPEQSAPVTSALQCGSTELFASIHDDCGAMDAVAAPGEDGDCYCFLGYAWNGTTCEALNNCQCEGEDCDKLSETKEACEQAHASCGGGSTSAFVCGSSELHANSHLVCEAMDAEAVPDDAGHCYCALGFAWNGSSCELLADCACQGQDCDKLTETQEQCEQAHAACDTTPQYQCGSSELHANSHLVCEAMDAEAVPDDAGHCNCALGFAWNGSSCELLADCACQGQDCDKLTETQEQCEQAHAACDTTPQYQCGSSELHANSHLVCEAMDAEAVPDDAGHCNCALGFAWNGSSCELLADCACQGQDCDKLTQTQQECEQAHAACLD